jgi:hypothetical protein
MYYEGYMMLRTGLYIMSCLTFQAKLLLYRHYVFVLDLFHILWCDCVKMYEDFIPNFGDQRLTEF